MTTYWSEKRAKTSLRSSDVHAREVDALKSTVFVSSLATSAILRSAHAKAVKMTTDKKPLREELNRKNSYKRNIQGRAAIVERTTAKRTTVSVMELASIVTLISATVSAATTTRVLQICP